MGITFAYFSLLGKVPVSTDKFIILANGLDNIWLAHFNIRTGNEYNPWALLYDKETSSLLTSAGIQGFDSELFFYQEDLITFIDARTYKARCDEQFKFEVSVLFCIYSHMMVNTR